MISIVGYLTEEGKQAQSGFRDFKFRVISHLRP